MYKHWPAKTVTESDDHLFCLITMNHHPLHLNDVYAAKSQQGRNVVVGPLVYSLALGMSVSDVSGKAIANLATEELKHPAPVFHGDTLYCESEVLEKKESQSKPDRGTVKVHTRVLNQDGVLVAEFKRLVLVPRKRPGRPRPSERRARARAGAGADPLVGMRGSSRHELRAACGTLSGPPEWAFFLFRSQRLRGAAAHEGAPTHDRDTKEPHQSHEHDRSRTHQERASAGVGRRDRGADRTRADRLVRRLGRGVRPALPASWSRRARSSGSRRPSARTPTWRCRIRTTWRASRTGRSSAPATEAEAGPTNNWRDPAEMREELTELFAGSMRGRTMYVVPFSMGPLGSDKSHIGVQLTDSTYVAVSMRIMTRMGQGALDALGATASSCPACTRSGMPLDDGVEDVPWPCNAENKYIVHFPETREIWSYGSGYGGNALLGKKCFALRIASVMARDEGWMAEHMLILKLTSPGGRGQVHHRRLPERLRQDQPRDADPDARGLEGRDDRRRHRLDEVRRTTAACTRSTPRPASSAWRRAPARTPTRTRSARSSATRSSPTARKTDDGDIWWEGLTKEPPAHLIDWHGNDWTPASRTPAAHPNARFTDPGRHRTRRSPPSGRTRPACRSTRCCSADAARRSCRW